MATTKNKTAAIITGNTNSSNASSSNARATLPEASKQKINNIPATTTNATTNATTDSTTNLSTKPLAPETINSLNSLISNNNNTAKNGKLGANNKFEKALNAELKTENNANNSGKILNSLNSRVKTSQQILDADKPAKEEPGFFGKLSEIAKSATNNVIPSFNKVSITGQPDIEPGELIDVQVKSENYVIILGVFIVLILIILIYFFSKTFNVSRTLDKMAMYGRYQSLSSIDMTQELATEPLYKFHIASAYNACHSGNQMFSYTSELIAKSALRSGARYLELNVFSSAYGPRGVPVVDSGYARGEWKLMVNTTTFESVIRIISENAFRVASSQDGVSNNTDPLFIGLNLSTGGNLYCLDLMADILSDYFSDKLLDAKYAFQFTADFAKTPLRELENKVVIFSSPGFEGSRLEEFVNAVWYSENFSASSGIAGTIESFKSNNKKINKNVSFRDITTSNQNTQITTKTNSKKKRSSSNIRELSRSLNKLTPGAKESNKYGVAGGPSNRQITAEKDKLTQNIRSLADELKDSGLEIQDVDDVEPSLTNPIPLATNSEINEKFGDETTPVPTELGLDAILGKQKEQARIMRICAQDFDSPGFDGGQIQAFTQSGGLCIVVPHREGDYITRNYDPQRAFELGCQFVAMNFQDIDEHMDKYITRFESKAILPIG